MEYLAGVCLLLQSINDGPIGLKVGHEGLMFLQEGLGRVLILAVVSVAHDRLLLSHPALCLVGVGKVLLGLKGVL